MSAENDVVEDLNALVECGLCDRSRVDKAISYVNSHVDEIREFRSNGMRIEAISDHVLMLV